MFISNRATLLSFGDRFLHKKSTVSLLAFLYCKLRSVSSVKLVTSFLKALVGISPLLNAIWKTFNVVAFFKISLISAPSNSVASISPRASFSRWLQDAEMAKYRGIKIQLNPIFTKAIAKLEVQCIL